MAYRPIVLSRRRETSPRAPRINALVEREGEALVFRVARRLDSPNEWRLHWSRGHKLTKWWEHAFETAIAIDRGHPSLAALRLDAGLAPGAPVGRRRVTVTRQVPNKRNFIRDDDDLRYTTKPVNDALKRLGLIRDDAREWLDQAMPLQTVSPDGRDWTIVRIEPTADGATEGESR